MKRESMEWIDATLSGTICREDFARLQEVLKSDSKAFDYYCQQAEIHGRLEWEFGDPQRQYCPVSGPETLLVPPSTRPAYLWLAEAAAIVLMLGALALQFGGGRRESDPVAEVPEHPAVDPGFGIQVPETSVARLTNSLEARWSGEFLQDGRWLTPQTIRLLDGSAEVSFDSGARVILQASSELEILTAHRARLLRGKGTVHIPGQASGFVLETPSSSFADLDSSFSVAVDDDGATEIHVLHGLVEATPRTNQNLARVLSHNEAVRLTDSDILGRNQIRYASASFDPELPVSEHAVDSRFLCWSFDAVDAGGVPEVGTHPGRTYPARILARPGTSQHASAEFIDGKFGRAVQLNGRGAFLSSEFPGIAGSAPRTVAFWVRIPPILRDDQSYSMIAWGSPGSRFGGKWQVAWNLGKDAGPSGPGVKGAIRTEFGGGFVIGETDLRDGRWHHVVVVFLGGRSVDVATHIRHYIDGRLESVSASKSQTINTLLTTPGALPTYIGRRLENDFRDVSFKGALDELYVFPAALTPEQIGDLHQRNKPPRRFVSSGLN